MAKFDIEVPLSNEDGNAFAIIGNVRRALRKAGATNEELTEFSEEAMSGDYNHLIQTAMEWVNVS